MLSSKLQMGLDMYWLKQGDTSGDIDIVDIYREKSRPQN
jgi:hypothetical protein